MKIFAIDPGNIESAFVIWDGRSLFDFGKISNNDMIARLSFVGDYDACAIEKIVSYGMAVGETVFETVFWSGRFAQSCIKLEKDVFRIDRMTVKMNLCKNPRAKDSNIVQALVDRFGGDASNKGKGTKKNPGFFYGFKKDIWQAFALGVTYLDMAEYARRIEM